MVLSSAIVDHNFTPSDEQLSQLRAQTKLTLPKMKEFYCKARSRPRPKGTIKRGSGENLYKESATSSLPKNERRPDGRFKVSTDVGHLFKVTQLVSPDAVTALKEWGVSSAGKKVKCFEGEGATRANSSIRFLEFMKGSSERVEYTEFFKGGDYEYFYKTPMEIQTIMNELQKKTAQLLVELRRNDVTTLTVLTLWKVLAWALQNTSIRNLHLELLL